MYRTLNEATDKVSESIIIVKKKKKKPLRISCANSFGNGNGDQADRQDRKDREIFHDFEFRSVAKLVYIFTVPDRGC